MSAQHQTIMLDLEAMAKGLSTVGWVKRWSGHEPITAEWFYEGEQEPRLTGVSFSAGARALTMNQHSLAVIFDEVAWIHEWSQGAEVECVFHYGMTGNGYENADGVEFRSCIETEVCHARR